MNKLRVKEVIKQKGLTSKDVAEKIGMSETGFSKAISDKGNPPLERLYMIAEILDVPVSELFEKNEAKSTCPHCNMPITLKIDK